MITIIFIICVSATITSFKEIPLNEVSESDDYSKLDNQFEEHFKEEGDVEKNGLKKENTSYGSLNQPDEMAPIQPAEDGTNVSIKEYLKSILFFIIPFRIIIYISGD